MAEGFRFMPLGLVMLRTCMGYLGATITQVFVPARGADVSLRDVTIAQRGNGARECEWRHAPEARAEDYGNFEKMSVESRTRLRTGRLTFASSPKPGQWLFGGCHTWGGGYEKASIERLCLSPYVEKPFNSKVIKSFVPELRSRKCFSCFGIPMFYVNMLWTFYVRFAYPYLAMVLVWFLFNGISTFLGYLMPKSFS